MNQFPRQKVPAASKTKKWFKECVDAAINMCDYQTDSSSRMSLRDKLIISKLANNEIDQEDIKKFAEFNNYEVDVKDVYVHHFPVIKPRINLLIGESIKRGIKYVVRAVNPEVVGKKAKLLKDLFYKSIEQYVNPKNPMPDKKDVDIFVEKFKRFAQYEFQEAVEVNVYRLLNYYYKYLSLNEKFMLGFADVMKYGEEIYCIESIGNKPIFRKCNPFGIHVFGLGNSNRIEDASIIVEDSYMSIPQVIDKYYEYLSPGDIDKLEKGQNEFLSSKDNEYTKTFPAFESFIFEGDSLISTSDVTAGFWNLGGNYNSRGEVRVTRVVWKGMEKIGKKYYYDENGIRQFELVSEFYKPNTELGEQVEYFWVTRWYEATRIRNDIYVKMETRDVPVIKNDGYIASGSGYVGTIYTDNSERAVSMYSQLKNYEYLYSILLRDLKRAIKKFKPPMLEIDLAKVPDSFELDEWLEYAEEMGYIITDSFKEGTKGISQGKLAGNFNTSGKIYNPDIGNYIQHLILFLNFIERQIAYASGVSDQRLGQISSTETVGGIERSVTQSSHITEPLFELHRLTIIRALQTLVDTIVSCARKDPNIIQFASDELANYIIQIDPEEVSTMDFGVFIISDTDEKNLLEQVKSFVAQYAVKSNMNIKSMINILTSSSFAEIKNIASQEELKMQEIAAQNAQQNQQLMLQQAEQELAIKERELAIKENELKVYQEVELAKISSKEKQTDDKNESREELERLKVEVNSRIEMMKLDIEKRKLEIELKKLALPKNK